MTYTKPPTCPVCKTRECSADGENGVLSYYSTCSACFDVVAAAPYCYNRDCSARACGTRTVLANAGPTITTATAAYACPNGCGSATAIGWARGSGIASGKSDAQRKIDGGDMAWLVDTRLSDRGIAGSYDATHPVRRAHARAYVDTARAILAEAGVSA